MPSPLFEPWTIRSATLRNRIGVSPMCQYSAADGHVGAWHVVHLGSRAVGGAGLVIAEATAVEARGRITPGCAGIWDDAHIGSWRAASRAIRDGGAVPLLQLAHAGWKAGHAVPWAAGEPRRGLWQAVGVGDRPFSPSYPTPQALSPTALDGIVAAFAAAARRAVEAGFAGVEVHGAHGYLLHSFYSPLSNQRTDDYGGSFDGRTRLIRRVVADVRQALGASAPLFVRLSCSDWADGGWTVEDSVALARRLRDLGADVIDCSSGGAAPDIRIPAAPGYQVPFAARIRSEAGVPTAAVGMIVEPRQAEAIVRDGQADLVLLAREMLRDPYWPLRAAKQLGAETPAPPQYRSAFA